MDAAEKREQDQIAYRRLKDTINATYPQGHFVAIDVGRIVADAPSFVELTTFLGSQGKNATETLIVQAGVDYPEYVVILFPGDGA